MKITCGSGGDADDTESAEANSKEDKAKSVMLSYRVLQIISFTYKLPGR